MKHRTSQILYKYWNEVRRDRLAPRRFDIEPARIAAILAETLILERVDRATYRFRLAGTRIGEQFAVELRGQNFLDLWAADDKVQVSGLLQQMTDYGGVGLIEFEATGSNDRTATFEAILLPLVHTRDVVDRFLGAMSVAGPVAWLGTERPAAIRLTRFEILWPDGCPQALTSNTNEPPPFHSYASQGRIVRQDRRQFRVLDGGRSAREPTEG